MATIGGVGGQRSGSADSDLEPVGGPVHIYVLRLPMQAWPCALPPSPSASTRFRQVAGAAPPAMPPAQKRRAAGALTISIGFAHFLLGRAPSSTSSPNLVAKVDDRRLPLTWSENRACFGGYRMLVPSIAGEQPQLCRSTAGNPSSRSLRSQGRHSDGNATAPPDSAAVPVVFRDRHVFAARVRLCGCAGRSYPSHSTSQLHELMGASPATRTRQVHAVSRWHRSRTGVSLPCAPKYLSALAHSDGKRASRSSLATRAQKRPLPADICGLLSPQAACSLCYTQGMHARSWQLLDCAWKAAAGGICVRYHANRAIRSRLQHRMASACSSSRCSKYPLRMC